MSDAARHATYEERRTLPPDWEWARLGEVCVPTIAMRDPTRTPDSSFVYVDISSIDNSSKKIVEPRRLLGRDAPSRARQVIHENDVLVSATRPNLNAVALVPPELDGQVCSTGFCVLRSGARVEPLFLFAYVKSSEFIRTVSDLVRGALYPAVTDRQVRDVYLPLPPLPEQRRIAAQVAEQIVAVERARATIRAQLDEINALPAAILRRAFSEEL